MMENLIILIFALPLVNLQQTYEIICNSHAPSTDTFPDYYECHLGDYVTYSCNNKRAPDNELVGNSIFDYVFKWNTCRNQTTALELIANDVNAITKWNMEGYPNLKSLNLSHNSIHTLGMNIFDNVNELAVLNLSHNKINSIDAEAISWLNELKILDLSNNSLTTLDNSALDGLSNLKELDLSENYIIDTKLSFINLKCLERLNLSHNALKDFNFDNFRNTPNIEILDLSYNDIKGSAKPIMFEGLDNLKYLDLSHNEIFRIDSGSFDGLNLYYFDISDNHLTGNLSADTFKGLKTMHLDISMQNIVCIKDWAFRDSNWITHLNISWNIISEIEVNSLRDLVELEELDLSGNSLTKFDMDVSDLTALKHLNLSFNEITNINNGIPTLVTLDMSHNKVKVLRPGLLENLVYLEILNLSHNGLVHMSGGAFKGLTSLISLDISFNNLYFVDGGLMAPLIHLDVLNLDGNHLRKFDFKGLFDSRPDGADTVTLSVNENPLECDWLKNALMFAKYNKSLMLNYENDTYTIENADDIECFDSYKKFDYSSKKTKPDRPEPDTRSIQAEVEKILTAMANQEAIPTGSVVLGMAVTVIFLAGIIFATYRIYNKKNKSEYTSHTVGTFSSLN